VQFFCARAHEKDKILTLIHTVSLSLGKELALIKSILGGEFMKKLIMTSIILLGLTFTASVGMAKDSLESELLLREALMSSNADYNKHKKAANEEEYERIDNWRSRDSQVIEIGKTDSSLIRKSRFNAEDASGMVQERNVSATSN
jgi:hypothetical protein